MKTHPDKDWSNQQKVLIDSQIKSAQELYKKNPEIVKRIIELMRAGKI